MFSRNAASSRAIPLEKMLSRVSEDPAMPKFWGENQSGMQAAQELSTEDIEEAKRIWLEARDLMVKYARKLGSPKDKGGLNVHKQIANRLTEPWMHITVLVSATNFMNWYGLRDHAMAQPELAWVAHEMLQVIKAAKPVKMPFGSWHLPLVPDENKLLREGFSEDDIKMICAGRCARVSYLTHDGQRDPKADIELATKLLSNGHMSPFEHAGRALEELTWSGNFRGFEQLRKTLPGESLFAHNSNMAELMEIEGLSVTDRLAV
jgi:hypothetical protein